MKKLLTTIVVVLFAYGAFAQVGAGIKVGANFANQDIEGLTTSSTTGYHFGAFFSLNLKDKLALQPEILFSKQGSEITVSSFTEEVDYSYLTIPVLFKYKFLRVLNLHLGPQFNILSRADYTDAQGTEEDITDQLKSTDFAIAAGAGINLPKGLTGGIRYVFGVSDINDGDYFGTSNPQIKNKTLQIYLGYRFFGD